MNSHGTLLLLQQIAAAGTQCLALKSKQNDKIINFIVMWWLGFQSSNHEVSGFEPMIFPSPFFKQETSLYTVSLTTPRGQLLKAWLALTRKVSVFVALVQLDLCMYCTSVTY